MTTLNMVMLADMVAPDTVAVAAKLSERAAQFGPVEIPEPDGDTAVFRMGEHMVFVSHMPGQIPAEDLEWPAQVAGWYWEDAIEQVKTHKSHVIVGTMSEADPITQHLLVTHTAAAVCEAANAICVYWGTSGVLTPSDMYIEQASTADAESLPVPLWLSVSWAKLEDGRMEIVTHGLTEFGHLELGSRSDDPDATFFLYDIAGYLMSSGAQLEHGQTIGSSEDEKLGIVHGPAPWEGDDIVVWIGD